MTRNAPGYPQSGLAEPPSAPVSQPSADPSHDAPAMDQDRMPYSQAQTPTSEYGMHPSSARSTTFPEHARQPPYQDSASQQQRFPPAAQHQSSGMPRENSPLSSAAPRETAPVHAQVQSDQDIPIDPSLARSGPGFPPSQYAYAPGSHEIPHGYPPHPQQANWRSDWAPQHSNAPPYVGMSPYSAAPPANSSSVASSPGVASRSPGQMNQVYSFVPIPGAQQHKRPRRKFEEIERMYTCGWNGCQKAYGTLNHLNAHVTMQNHGPKRVPDEFKEIRREWKARKKEEELQQKKQDEEKGMQGEHPHDGPNGHGQPYETGRPHLPPLNYSGAPGMQYGYPPTSGEQMPMYPSAPGYPPYSQPYASGPYPPEYAQHGAEYPPGSNPPGPGYRQ